MTKPPENTPYQPLDQTARDLVQGLLGRARHAAIALRDPLDPRLPYCARIAFGLDRTGGAITFVSRLAHHTQALLRDPLCCLLIGDPADRGDPLSHPRLSLQARGEFVPRESAEHLGLSQDWQSHHPKAKLYLDFADFGFLRFHPISGLLNAGFGRAYRITAADLSETQTGGE